MVSTVDGIILGVAFLIMVAIFLIVLSFYDHKKRTKRVLYFQLKSWVKRARELGHSDEKMEGVLLQHGWDKKHIQAALGTNENKDNFYR